MKTQKIALIIIAAVLLLGLSTILGCQTNIATTNIVTKNSESILDDDATGNPLDETARLPEDEKKEYFDQYIGDWYGLKKELQNDDGKLYYYEAHVHVDNIEYDNENDMTYIRGYISHTPRTVTDSFDTKHILSGHWEEPKKHFYLLRDSNTGDEYFELSNSDPDVAILATWNGKGIPSTWDDPYTIILHKLSSEEVQQKKADFNKWFNEFRGESSSKKNEISKDMLGSWSGVIPYNFTATMNDDNNSLIVEWSDGNFNFDLRSSDSALYNSQYGEVILYKE